MKTKTIISKALILGGLSVLASASYGSTLYLASSASETANNSGSATVNISPNPQWSPAFSGTSWVSYTQSGNPNQPGYVVPANGTEVTFTDSFNIQGTPTLASLIVMADDTTSVSVNGVMVVPMAPTTGNTYTTCSDFTIGCSAATAAGLNILSDLHTGANTLSFTVEQIAGWSFGLDYSATIVSTTPAVSASSATPEPGTLALLSLPLIALSLIRRKKIQA
jgi:hypothetical protein